MEAPTYKDLKEKTILITGVTRGIGRTLALELAKQGTHVVFNYRGDPNIANQLKEEIIELGGKATPLLFDITNFEQIKTAINGFLKDVGPIQGLVNNAGISKDQIVLRLKEEDISKTLDTNLKGAMLVTSALSRSFLKAKNVSVINMSSVVGLMGNPSQISYAASKAGLIGFTKSYAKELGSRNIRCNAVCPGYIKTDMTSALADKAKETLQSHIPLKRIGDTAEVANLVLFLLSDASSYITGEVIKIDGGIYI